MQYMCSRKSMALKSQQTAISKRLNLVPMCYRWESNSNISGNGMSFKGTRKIIGNRIWFIYYNVCFFRILFGISLFLMGRFTGGNSIGYVELIISLFCLICNWCLWGVSLGNSYTMANEGLWNITALSPRLRAVYIP